MYYIGNSDLFFIYYYCYYYCCRLIFFFYRADRCQLQAGTMADHGGCAINTCLYLYVSIWYCHRGVSSTLRRRRWLVSHTSRAGGPTAAAIDAICTVRSKLEYRVCRAVFDPFLLPPRAFLFPPPRANSPRLGTRNHSMIKLYITTTI